MFSIQYSSFLPPKCDTHNFLLGGKNYDKNDDHKCISNNNNNKLLVVSHHFMEFYIQQINNGNRRPNQMAKKDNDIHKIASAPNKLLLNKKNLNRN